MTKEHMMHNCVQVETPTEVKLEPRKKWSAVSIVGFGFSLLAFSIYLALTLNIFLEENFGAMMWGFLLYVFALPVVFVGIIVSIIGLVIAIKRTRRGKGFAIAGIVMCAPCLVWGLIWTCRILLPY